MEQLTPKQIYQREYHARNAERIRAQKRAYAARIRAQKRALAAEKRLKDETGSDNKPQSTWRDYRSLKPVSHKSNLPKVSSEDAAKRKARYRIEDILMSRELGIDVSEL